MPEYSRKYNALVQITDAEVLGRFLSQVIAGQQKIDLTMGITGVEVTDDHIGLSQSEPFKGRSEPKLAESASLTWQSTPTSRFSVGLNSPSESSLNEEICLSNGFVKVEPVHLRGKNHSEFNRKFKDGLIIDAAYLRFRPNRLEAQLEHRIPRRRTASILPLLGRIKLLEFPV